MTPILSPSLLSADFARLGEAAQKVVNAGAQWLHLDVMDNHFVPNLTFGAMFCQSLRDYGITAPLDVHLMVTPPDRMIEAFAKAGATYITIHVEASDDIEANLKKIKSLGCYAGLSIRPNTPVSALQAYLPLLDLILIMSVEPGFGGQVFIPRSLEKLRATRQMIDACGHSIRLSVDGGITLDNIDMAAQAGADTFVVGSAIFNAKDPTKVIRQLIHHHIITKL